MKLSDLSLTDLEDLFKAIRFDQTQNIKVLADLDKIPKNSIIKIVWGRVYEGDIEFYVKNSRGHEYFLGEADLDKLEIVSGDAPLYTPKWENPPSKPGIVKQQVYDSMGQEINPGDYVVMSYGESLVHAKFIKQHSNTMFIFHYQFKKYEFKRRILADNKGVCTLPDSLKMWSGTMDHLMMKKLARTV